MNGYIKLHRSLMDNPFWKKKPFSDGQAWVELLMMASWKADKRLVGGNVITVNKGEVSISQKWLSDRWGWDRRKVSRFLRALERAEMVSVDGTTNGTTITIENYSRYQDECPTDGTGYGTTSAQPMYNECAHIKKEKKEKKVKNLSKRESKEKADLPFEFKYREPDIMSEEESAQLLHIAHDQFAPIKARLMAEAAERIRQREAEQ